jgi:hypothetical protein
MEKTDEKPLEKKGKEKQNKQLKWAIFLMIAVLLMVIIVPWITNTFFNKFNYAGLEFQKTKLGKIVFYSTKIPIVQNEQIVGSYAINLRSDPRKINVETNVSGQDIKFVKKNLAFISLNPNMQRCEDNSLALINFAGFLRDFAGLSIKSAVSDINFSEESKIVYADCNANPENTVIKIDNGNKTEIKKISDNCYELTFKNCEIMQVTEKFNLIILEEYMKYFEKN